METTIDLVSARTGSSFLPKLHDLCAALSDQPEFLSIRERIESFGRDEAARAQLAQLNEQAGLLQQKQQMGMALDDAEIAGFERLREGFVANPVAQGFLAAQEEMQALRDTINDHIGKTFELGRAPKASDFAGSCGSGCGCGN
jgi:cell fate (sporulation/competence/biofilm development) regulator YlbF (YheA/YmcA/DUF963 family)